MKGLMGVLRGLLNGTRQNDLAARTICSRARFDMRGMRNSKISESRRDVTAWTSVVRANVLPSGRAVAVRLEKVHIQSTH